MTYTTPICISDKQLIIYWNFHISPMRQLNSAGCGHNKKRCIFANFNNQKPHEQETKITHSHLDGFEHRSLV